MIRKTTKVDFYLVGEESPDLEILLNNIQRQPIDSDKRTIEHNEDWIRLARGEPEKNGFFGDMIRINMKPPGFKAGLDGQIEPILFNSDEGIGDCAAFYYDYDSRILCLQRNSKSVSVGQLAHYFKQMADSQEVVLLPVVRPTDLGKVRVLNQLRKIHISANIIEVMPTIDDIDSNTKSIIQNSIIAESPAIEIILKSGRGKEDTLNQTAALETIESWLKIHENFSDDENEIVKKIEVSGKDDSGERVEFDLLKDRMFTQMDFEWVPEIDILWENRRKQIQVAWDLNHKNVKQNLPTAD